MNVEELFDKYIEEPRLKSKRDYKNNLQKMPNRLKFYKRNYVENYSSIILAITLIALFGVVHWSIYRNIETTQFIAIIGIITSILMYHYKSRYCNTCSKKMGRVLYNDYYHYFCDDCKVLYKSNISVGD
jgi:uncharacterized membrane protein